MSEAETNQTVSTKPVKINKWDTNALKNALDDACKKYFKETLQFTEDYSLMNRRLLLSLVACLFALYALVYDWFHPFPKSRTVLIVCVVSYFILIGILTLYMQFVEAGKFFRGKLVDRAGVDPSARCTISSKLKKYDDKYSLTLQYNDGIQEAGGSTGAFVSSVGSYFDENGVLCSERFTNDLRKIYDQARSNARKVK